jgi:replicative superfamily II helicase
MLSFAPEAFQDVGLLVFDECHLLSPEIGRIRRALDAMLCVLGFNHVAQEADMLFLSAMLKNVDDMAAWVAALTERPCVAVDLPWKPSRQARGVIIYDDAELTRVQDLAAETQRKADVKARKKAATLRQAAKNQLNAAPYAILAHE